MQVIVLQCTFLRLKDVFFLNIFYKVTVRSDDADEECLLVVSDECPNVVNLDPRQATDKDLRSGLRLSFTTLGRITLSHGSKPQLKTGRWFVGVFLKNPRHNPNRTVMKTVEVSLGFAGATERWPALSLFGISLIGFLIAVYAHLCLNPDPKDRLVVWCTDLCCKQNGGGARYQTLPDSNGSSESQLNQSQLIHGSSYAYTTAIVGFSLVTGAAQFIILNWRNMINSGNRDICYYNDFCYRSIAILCDCDIPFNLMISNLVYVTHGIVLFASILLRQYCTSKTTNDNTTNNNTTNNNTANNNTANNNTTNDNTKRAYSIAYAFSWALIFEGIFSSLYHLCPSRMTFQFDSAFMFVMCGLAVAAVFNYRKPVARSREAGSVYGWPASQSNEAEPSADSIPLISIQPDAPSNEAQPDGSAEAQPDGSAVSSLVCASKLFLFFISPLLIINYLGSIHNTDGFQSRFQNYLFYVLVLAWIISMFIWAVWVWCWLYILFVGVVGVVWHFTVIIEENWSHFFLFSCLSAAVLTVLGFCFTKCLPEIVLRKISRQYLSQCLRECSCKICCQCVLQCLACPCKCCKISCQCVLQCFACQCECYRYVLQCLRRLRECCDRKINCQCLCKWVFIAIYIVGLAVCWKIALYFEKRSPTRSACPADRESSTRSVCSSSTTTITTCGTYILPSHYLERCI